MKKYWPLVWILVLGLVLRLYHTFDVSLWHDEAFSALMIRFGWGEMFRRLALDVHPPMYYIFLKFWHMVFGDTIVSLRGFTMLFGLLTIWATWLFVKYVFKDAKLALWAALLVAINPFFTFQLQYASEARMYTIGAFFGILTAYFLARALREQKQFYEDERLNMPNMPQDIDLRRSYFWHYFWFAVCAGIMDLTHYYLLFSTAALCLYALIYHMYHYGYRFKRYLMLLTSYFIILLLFLPWLKQFLFQYRQVQAGYWIPPMDIWSIPGALWTMLVGLDHNNANPLTLKLMAVLFLFVVFLFWRFLRKTQVFEKWLILLATLAPFGGAMLFAVLARLKGSNSSVFEERYFLFCSIFFIIAVAAWLNELRPKWLSVCLLIAYCGFNLYAFSYYWGQVNIQSRPGMAAAAQFLSANVTDSPSSHVFVASQFEFFNYKYYDATYSPLPAQIRPLLFSNGRGDISQISHVEGVALLNNSDLLPSYSAAVKPGDTVWLLWTNAFYAPMPELPKNWAQIDQKDYPDVWPVLGSNIYVTEYRVN